MPAKMLLCTKPFRLVAISCARSTGAHVVDSIDIPLPHKSLNGVEMLLKMRIIQVSDIYKKRAEAILDKARATYFPIGTPIRDNVLSITHVDGTANFVSVPAMRKVWFEPSYRFELLQTARECAEARRDNFASQPLQWRSSRVSRPVIRSVIWTSLTSNPAR